MDVMGRYPWDSKPLPRVNLPSRGTVAGPGCLLGAHLPARPPGAPEERGPPLRHAGHHCQPALSPKRGSRPSALFPHETAVGYDKSYREQSVISEPSP